jgi:hypothetical protein
MMICFRAWPLYLRDISIGTVLEKQFETRNIQLERHRQLDIKDRQSNRQIGRQTDRQTERQTDRLGSSQSRCESLGEYKISRTYRESTKNSYIT